MSIIGGNIENSPHSFLTLGTKECHRQCQLHLECNHFVYDSHNSNCTLKRSDAFKSFKLGNVVGPKYCGNFSSARYKYLTNYFVFSSKIKRYLISILIVLYFRMF